MNGIDIGRRVEVRSGPLRGRKGRVVQNDGSKLWGIKFDDDLDTTHNNISSSRLKIIQDKRTFHWKCVEESFPEAPVQEFCETGVVGFDFNQFSE